MAVCDWCQRELPPASKKASNVRRFCSDKHRQLAYRWRKNYPNVTVWGKDPAAAAARARAAELVCECEGAPHADTCPLAPEWRRVEDYV